MCKRSKKSDMIGGKFSIKKYFNIVFPERSEYLKKIKIFKQFFILYETIEFIKREIYENKLDLFLPAYRIFIKLPHSKLYSIIILTS